MGLPVRPGRFQPPSPLSGETFFSFEFTTSTTSPISELLKNAPATEASLPPSTSLSETQPWPVFALPKGSPLYQ